MSHTYIAAVADHPGLLHDQAALRHLIILPSAIGAQKLGQVNAVEVEEGMDITAYSSRPIMRTAAEAGSVLCTTSSVLICPPGEDRPRAVARTRSGMGVLIITRDATGAKALEPIQMLVTEGVDPQHSVIRHADCTPDPIYRIGMAEIGAFQEGDGLAGPSAGPTVLQ